jgi:heme-degrading monooxygenase HmoA
MIARQWIGETRESDAEAYVKYLEETGVRHCKGVPGNRGVLVLKRVYDRKAQFIFMSFWDSIEAIKAFAGAEYEKAVYYPEDERFLLAKDPKVTHFEVEHRS